MAERRDSFGFSNTTISEFCLWRFDVYGSVSEAKGQFPNDNGSVEAAAPRRRAADRSIISTDSQTVVIPSTNSLFHRQRRSRIVRSAIALARGRMF